MVLLEKFQPPVLEKNTICITSREADLELISAVSCYFNKSSVYFPIFQLATAEYPFNESSLSQDDDYLTNAIVNKQSIQILNCASRIKCRRIILVGITELQKTYLRLERFFRVEVIEINSLNDIDKKLKFLGKKFDGVLICKEEEIARGLIYAKRNNKKLVVDENASKIDSLIENNGKGLIVIESDNDVSDVIISNYASSLDADVMFIKTFNFSELKDIKDSLIKWKRNNSYGAYLNLSKIINESMNKVDIDKYSYATFFTDGVPYGVFYNEKIPCSHVFRHITEDIFIFNNILFEEEDLYTGSSVVFSPQPEDLGDYPKLESEKIISILNENSFYTKKLLKRDATVNAFDFYVAYYPYDLLHLCSHGGEIDGYYVIQEFKDREGKKHIIEYEEIVGFSPDGKGKVHVVSKKMFRFLDGFVWRSEELKNKQIPQFVYYDMSKALLEDGEKTTISRKKIDRPIEASCHIQCHDGIHQGQFHSIASESFPLIFNNTCNSWLEFSTLLIAGGCRAYIGTLWSIGNELAYKSAQLFYEKVFTTNIINAVNIMVNSIEDENYKDIYIFYGLHFSTLKKISKFSKEKIIYQMVVSLQRWIDYTSRQVSIELLENAIRAIKFLCKELTPYFQDPRIMRLLTTAMRVIKLYESKNPSKTETL